MSSIPYAELYYGADTKSEEISLAKYVRDFQRSTSSKREHPDYIFDGQVLHHHSRLSRDAPIPELFSSFSISLRQFIIGPRRSGSPPHFHGHAFNALVYGVKLWYLWPPSEAYFAFSPCRTGRVATWRGSSVAQLHSSVCRGRETLCMCLRTGAMQLLTWKTLLQSLTSFHDTFCKKNGRGWIGPWWA